MQYAHVDHQPYTFDIYNWHFHQYEMLLQTVEDCLLEVLGLGELLDMAFLYVHCNIGLDFYGFH